MILSHRHRFIFIKTLKTAGTSIEVSFSRYCGPDDVLTPITPPEAGHSPRNHAGFYNHMPAAEIRRQVGPDIWNGYFKFAFERNPWDKVVSYYHWVQALGHRFASFEDFIAQCVRQERFPLQLPSSRALYHLDGALAVDRVGAYESLEQDLTAICSRLGIAFDGWLPRAKSGLRPKAQPYSAYYTPATRALVALYFAPEIRQLGYRFDGGAGGAEDLTEQLAVLGPGLASTIPRSKPCPCGSGLRFKNCHGAAGSLAGVGISS
jgi:hypothetical protein